MVDKVNHSVLGSSCSDFKQGEYFFGGVVSNGTYKEAQPTTPSKLLAGFLASARCGIQGGN